MFLSARMRCAGQLAMNPFAVFHRQQGAYIRAIETFGKAVSTACKGPLFTLHECHIFACKLREVITCYVHFALKSLCQLFCIKTGCARQEICLDKANQASREQYANLLHLRK